MFRLNGKIDFQGNQQQVGDLLSGQTLIGNRVSCVKKLYSGKDNSQVGKVNSVHFTFFVEK